MKAIPLAPLDSPPRTQLSLPLAWTTGFGENDGAGRRGWPGHIGEGDGAEASEGEDDGKIYRLDSRHPSHPSRWL